jgi:hypothetical protein
MKRKNKGIVLKPSHREAYNAKRKVEQMAKSKKEDIIKDPEPKRRGRKPGSSPSEVIMLNRYTMNFYKCIKNSKGKVIGRDYSVHSAHLAKLIKSFENSQDSQTVKFLKAVKKCSYREDIVKYVPNLIEMTTTTAKNYPIGTFYNEDTITLSITDKEATTQNIINRFKEISENLIKRGMVDIHTGLLLKWGQLKTAKLPPTKSKDPVELENKQLKAFKW